MEICGKLPIENIEARNEVDEDVAGYVKPVFLSWERIPLPEGYRNVSGILHGVLGEKVEKLRAMHLLPRNVTVTKRMLLDLGETLHRRLASRRAGYLFGAMLLQSQAISLQHAIELVETQGISSLTSIFHGCLKARTGPLAPSRTIRELLTRWGGLSLLWGWSIRSRRDCEN